MTDDDTKSGTSPDVNEGIKRLSEDSGRKLKKIKRVGQHSLNEQMSQYPPISGTSPDVERDISLIRPPERPAPSPPDNPWQEQIDRIGEMEDELEQLREDYIDALIIIYRLSLWMEEMPPKKRKMKVKSEEGKLILYLYGEHIKQDLADYDIKRAISDRTKEMEAEEGEDE